jgi:hypothetical protein
MRFETYLSPINLINPINLIYVGVMRLMRLRQFRLLRSATKIPLRGLYVLQAGGVGRWTKNPKDYHHIPLRIKAIRMPALSPVPCECPGFGFSTSRGSGDR